MARVLTLAEKNKIKGQDADSDFEKQTKKVKENCQKSLETFRFNEALSEIWDLISFCDKRINEEKPWSFDPAQDREKIGKFLGSLLLTISEIANLIGPFLPETSEKILHQLKNGKSEPLFPRVK